MASSRTNLENLARAKQLNAEPPDEREMANLLAGELKALVLKSLKRPGA